MYLKKCKNKYKMLPISSKFCLIQEANTHGKSITSHVQGLSWSKIKDIYKRVPKAAHDKTIEEFSKAYFPARNQIETEATNGMMRLLSLEHLSFRVQNN